MDNQNSPTEDSPSPRADEVAADVATSAATTPTAAHEAVSALPAGESAPAGNASPVEKLPFTVTPKEGEPFGVRSIHTAHRFLAEGAAVMNNETGQPVALGPAKAIAPKQ